MCKLQKKLEMTVGIGSKSRNMSKIIQKLNLAIAYVLNAPRNYIQTSLTRITNNGQIKQYGKQFLTR